MYHAWLFDFLDGLGGGNDPLNFQNRAIGGFWENARFIRSNGRKTTFEWPKVVSKVIFPRFWGVVCIEKCFRNFEILIRSAVFEMSRFCVFLTMHWQAKQCGSRKSPVTSIYHWTPLNWRVRVRVGREELSGCVRIPEGRPHCKHRKSSYCQIKLKLTVLCMQWVRMT